MPCASYSEIMLGGLKTACVSRHELAALMVEQCLARRNDPAIAPFAVNGHTLSLAASDSDFRSFHDFADIVHADGQALVFASKLLTSDPVPERSATTDFFHDAARAASAHGLKFFLLGATEEVNARCAQEMAQLYPGLRIVGRRNGYFAQSDEAAICEEINRSGADIVWIGLGLPLEQAFCVRNRHRLCAGWLVTAGGCFNYVTGHYRRAPQWLQSAGFEWLHRLWHEPRRLFWRYAITNPHAVFLLLTRTNSIAAPTKPARLGPKVAEVRA
jgi:exopolysaccharide biosynthesis WecB/TagA/CpsF family protein